MESKRVLISYSHADKFFVQRLVESLNRNGVPLFFDEWEIRPGDSLIRKIFEEGLAKSAFFIIVLSKASVSSAWVKEELDVATARRIEGSTRVVPVLLEDCEIPWSLRALQWLDMRQDFEDGVRELTKLVYGADERPAPGLIPPYIQSLSESIGGLSRQATTIGLYLIGRADLDGGTILQVGGDEISQATSLSPQEVDDSVEEMEGGGLVRTIKWLGTSPFHFGVVVPTYVLFQHLKEQLPYDPDEDSRIVLNAVAASGRCDARGLKDRTNLSIGRLNRTVDYLEDYGLVEVIKHLGTAPYSFAALLATKHTRQAVMNS